MAKTFHLTIAKVGENLFEGDAVSATFPGVEGELTVLAQHEAFVTSLTAGVIRIEPSDGERIEVAITDSGVLEISNNQATVIL